MPMIFDTHTHIYLNKNTDIETIIKNLKNDWIKKIISIWIDLETSLKSIELAKKYPNIVYATVGIHPTDTMRYKDDVVWTLNKLEHIILENLKYIKWIGECWFDYFHIDKNNIDEEKDIQKSFFEWQLKLAKKYLLPVVIHTRDSKEDTLNSIKNIWFKKFILHCFSEDLDFAYKAIYYSDECFISFSWIVTYKNAQNVQHTASNIPTNKILVETDSPFLSPQTVRWTENIPNNTRYNLEKVFELRKENWKKDSREDFKSQIYKNSINAFNI